MLISVFLFCFLTFYVFGSGSSVQPGSFLYFRSHRTDVAMIRHVMTCLLVTDRNTYRALRLEMTPKRCTVATVALFFASAH